MSHDVKYIGMDVHKEAIVIAVLNGSGELVMEKCVYNSYQQTPSDKPGMLSYCSLAYSAFAS